MNLESLTAELLARPLGEFTTWRNAKARELKAAGQVDLATQLSALQKPSLQVWAINQLARSGRAQLDRLREAAAAVAKTQAAASAGRPTAARDLRAASDAFQRQLEEAGNAAVAALRHRQHAAGPEVVRRIYDILRLAAVQGGAAWQRLEQGALIAEPQAGEDVLQMFATDSGTTADARKMTQAESRRAEAKRAEAQEAQAAKVALADQERAERAAATARRLRQEATEMAAAAEKAAARARAAEAEAADAQAQAEKSGRASRRRP